MFLAVFRRKIRTSLFISLFYLSFPVLAGIHVNNAVIIQEPGQDYQEVTVFNGDAQQPAYVEVETFEVINPGTEQESRVFIVDPQQVDFIVSPNRLVIPAGGRKSVRMIHLKPIAEHDKVYRVTFKPVVGKIHSNQSVLKIMVAYQSLVIVRPLAPSFDLRFVRDGQVVTFSNAGNSMVYLKGLRQCNADNECEKYNGKRLYAGASWQLTLNSEFPLELVEQQSGRSIRHQIP